MAKGARGEANDEFTICGKEIIAGKVGARNPEQGLEGEIAGLGAEAGGEEDELNLAGQFGVAMAGAMKFGADDGFDAQLLEQFAGESRFGGLAEADFAAGKFPAEGEGIAAASLAGEESAIAFNQSGDDVKHGASPPPANRRRRRRR